MKRRKKRNLVKRIIRAFLILFLVVAINEIAVDLDERIYDSLKAMLSAGVEEGHYMVVVEAFRTEDEQQIGIAVEDSFVDILRIK